MTNDNSPILETERRLTGLEIRVNQLEGIVDEIHTLSSTMIEMCSEIKHISTSVNRLDTRVQSIEDHPRDTIKVVRNAVITSLASAVIGAIVSATILLM